MQIVTVTKEKFKGDYNVYQLGEPDCPESVSPTGDLKVGEWIKDDNGLVAQVLKVEVMRPQSTVMAWTCFGADVVAAMTRNGWLKRATDFKRPRRNFDSLSKFAKHKLTMMDKVFLRALLIYPDPKDAYEAVYHRKIETFSQKNNLSYKISILIKLPVAKDHLMATVKELLRERGADLPEFYVNKILNSIPDIIDKPVHLEMMKMLAASTGDKDIQDFMLGPNDNTPADNNLLPMPTASVEVIQEAKQLTE